MIKLYRPSPHAASFFRAAFPQGITRMLAVVILLFLAPFRAVAAEPPSHASLIDNGHLESDVNGDQWPDTWPTLKAGGSWVEEEDNHFLRFTSTEPGATVMMYREIPIPPGVRAIEISWKHRLKGFKRGKQSWFDARMMLEFMDRDRQKTGPSPKAPNFTKDIPEWQDASTRFLVPPGATTLNWMPVLLQVSSGTWDLDDLQIRSTDPAPIEAAEAAAKKEREKKLAATALQRRAKAKVAWEARPDGSLLSNGDFEKDANNDNWPDHWGKPKKGGSWEAADGNRWLKLASPAPHEMVMLYQTYDLPEGIEALELAWKQRITGLKKGKPPGMTPASSLSSKTPPGRNSHQVPARPTARATPPAGWRRPSGFLSLKRPCPS